MNFGKYRLLEELGSGGMATVHRAMLDGPEGFELELVIKRIRGDFSEMTSNSLSMLLTEARVSAKLRHPSIVQVYELGDVSGEFYLAMELVDGWDLRQLLDACENRRHPLPPGVACFIVGQVANALAYAHSLKEVDGRPLGILHRDLSPSNVMVTSAGGVKLLDFGIAKVAAHVRHDLPDTAEHTIKGKVVYMSPEQTRGLALDGRSDLFSLGIVFYELLTGKRPFNGENMVDNMLAICQGKFPLPSKLRTGIPKEVDVVIQKMLTAERDDRYANGAEVFQALTQLTRRLQGDAASLQTTINELGLVSFRSASSSTASAIDHDRHEPSTSVEAAHRTLVGAPEGMSTVAPIVPTDLGAVIFRGSDAALMSLSQESAALPAKRRSAWPLVLVAALAGGIAGVWLWGHGPARDADAAALAARHAVSAPAAAAPLAPEPIPTGTGGNGAVPTPARSREAAVDADPAQPDAPEAAAAHPREHHGHRSPR